MGKFAIADELHALTKAISGGNGGSSGPGKHIYGVRWGYSIVDADGTDIKCINTTGTRTDEAADFSDPVPYYASIENPMDCGSPFDNLYPWNGMTPYKDPLLVNMVAIPRFWYKWTKTDDYMQLQIATYAAEGFSLSPAHRARNANDRDREVVYIARYHSGTIDQGKKWAPTNVFSPSLSGATPTVKITRANMRNSINQVQIDMGLTGYSQQDYAMFWTWRMLYLVEYANWDGQAAIGFGCGNNDDTGTTGASDNMPYHTGTMAASLDTQGQGVQYRHIEDPWVHIFELVEGWDITEEISTKVYGVKPAYVNIIMDPEEFGDESGNGVTIASYPGGRSDMPNGWIVDWTIPEVDGYDWALMPVASDNLAPDENEVYPGVADHCMFGGPVLACGADWDQFSGYGPFIMWSVEASNANSDLGARLQLLPGGGLGVATPNVDPDSEK